MPTYQHPYFNRSIPAANIDDISTIIRNFYTSGHSTALPIAVDVISAYAAFTFVELFFLFTGTPKFIQLTTQLVRSNWCSHCAVRIYLDGSYKHIGTCKWQQSKRHEPCISSEGKWFEPIRGYQSELTEAQWKFAMEIWNLYNCKSAVACDNWLKEQ